MNTKITSFIFALVFSFSAIAQKSILFLGGIAHLGNGEVIKNSAISISNCKFDLVADATNIRIDPNAFDTIYKIYNKHIYPSLILPNTTLGLAEIDAVRASRDEREVGLINSNVRSQIAFNTESIVAEGSIIFL